MKNWKKKKPKKKKTECSYWTRGFCRAGRECGELHTLPQGYHGLDVRAKECGMWSHRGWCGYGQECIKLHFEDWKSLQSPTLVPLSELVTAPPDEIGEEGFGTLRSQCSSWKSPEDDRFGHPREGRGLLMDPIEINGRPMLNDGVANVPEPWGAGPSSPWRKRPRSRSPDDLMRRVLNGFVNEGVNERVNERGVEPAWMEDQLQAVKRMWEYIKANNLQDPADRRNIICDDTLNSIIKRRDEETRLLQELQESNRSLNEYVQVLESEKRSLAQDFQVLESEKARLAHDFQELQQRSNILVASNEELQQRSNILVASNEELQQQSNILMASNTELQSELRFLRDLQQDIPNFEQALVKMKEDLKMANGEKERLKVQNERMKNTDKKKLFAENEKLKKDLDGVHFMVAKRDKQIQEKDAIIESNLQTMSFCIDDVKNLNEKSEVIRALENELDISRQAEMRAKLEFSMHMQEKEEHLKALQQQQYELVQQIQNVESINSALLQELDRWKTMALFLFEQDKETSYGGSDQLDQENQLQCNVAEGSSIPAHERGLVERMSEIDIQNEEEFEMLCDLEHTPRTDDQHPEDVKEKLLERRKNLAAWKAKKAQEEGKEKLRERRQNLAAWKAKKAQDKKRHGAVFGSGSQQRQNTSVPGDFPLETAQSPSSGRLKSKEPSPLNMDPTSGGNPANLKNANMNRTGPTPRLPINPGAQNCKFYMDHGKCKFGVQCQFNHPVEVLQEIQQKLATTQLGPHGLPLRPDAEECYMYREKGHCRFGQTCKFHHPVTNGQEPPWNQLSNRIHLDGSVVVQVQYLDGKVYQGRVVGYYHYDVRPYIVHFDDGDKDMFSLHEIQKYAEPSFDERNSQKLSDMDDSLSVHQSSLETKKEIQSFEKIWALKNAFTYNYIKTWNLLEAHRRQIDALNREQLVTIPTLHEEYRHKVKVKRANVVNEVFSNPFFKESKLHGQHSAFANLEVRFSSSLSGGRERGIDAGGLSKEFNSLFWEQLEEYLADDDEFEGRNEANQVMMFHKVELGSTVFLPVAYRDSKGTPYPLTEQLEEKYACVGRMLLRAFMNNQIVPSSFASNILVDYLLNFDLRYSTKPVQEMLLDLIAADPSYGWVQKVFKDKCSKIDHLLGNGDTRLLHGENARAILKNFIKDQVIIPREQQFQAICKGFFLDHTFSVGPFLEICSNPKELRLLLSGEETFTADRLWETIDFQNFGGKEKTAKEQLRSVLEAMSEKELRLFLKFVTGLYALPANNRAEAMRITIKPDKQISEGKRFPQAQTCDCQLTLPEYKSKDEMYERMIEAIQPCNSHFLLK